MSVLYNLEGYSLSEGAVQENDSFHPPTVRVGTLISLVGGGGATTGTQQSETI